MSGEDGESVDPRRPNHDPDDLEPHHHSINPWLVFGFLRSFVNIFVFLGFISPRAPRRVCWFSTSVVGAAKASTKLCELILLNAVRLKDISHVAGPGIWRPYQNRSSDPFDF